MNIFIARQPILDLSKRVFGYELLFRAGLDNSYPEGDGRQASLAVISNSMCSFGLDALVGRHRAFINATQELLSDELLTVVPASRTVVEVLETVEPDASTIAACRALKQAGYLLALDDFVGQQALEPLLDLADFVKVDFMQLAGDERRRVATHLKKWPVRLVAEKVESHADFEEGRDSGYSYFQGYFFCRPHIVTSGEVPGFKLNYLRFIQEVNRPEIDFDQLEHLIKQEVSLTLRLLRYLNSAAFGWVSKVTSIRDALVRLGQQPLKKWASLVAFSYMADNKPAELIITCLVRGRLCESLAPLIGHDDNTLELFLAGLLSGIDALLDRPLEQILETVTINDKVVAALLDQDSDLGRVLSLVIAYERGDWEDVAVLTETIGLRDIAVVPRAYNESIEWVNSIFRVARRTPPPAECVAVAV